MEYPFDINGVEVHEGDVIAYAMRVGNYATLGTYKITEVKERSGGRYFTQDVKAQQLTKYGREAKTTRASILRGELFASRALIVTQGK